VEGPYLGVSWDGTGYGLDGSIWGGECFRVENGYYDRVAHLRPFNLPGGDAAIRESWRSAASLLFELKKKSPKSDEQNGMPHFSPVLREVGTSNEQAKIRYMLEKGINTVPTTSVGRLFDAVASISGLAHQNRFEGQAAMMLENEIGALQTEEAYSLNSGDWAPLLERVLKDRREEVPVSRIAARFHNALVNWIVEVAGKVGEKQIVLSGGVFQNRYLTERAAAVLESSGYKVHMHQRVPPNDGGIALGQVVMAS
ncbi:MAG TPA: carbamoyltransferase HypF, partial [Candidatus Eisenbacteria bacterium]|nr:carbamoyltransferase HypF [Candidatus Eisenbacteria bacterium]